MSDTKATIILSAKDEASGVIDGVGKELQNFSTKAEALNVNLKSSGLSMAGLGLAGSAALAKMNIKLDEASRLLNIAKGAAAETAKSLASLKIDPNALTVPDKAIQSLQTWQEKFAYTMGAGLAIGFDKAKTLWGDLAEFIKKEVVIFGVALAVGISAAVVGAIYAATKGISFAIGLITGESYKSVNIDALIAANREIKILQESLPLTAVGASALNEALKAQGTTIAAYSATINGVSTSIHTNADELTRLGVKFKDQNGNYLATNVILQNAAVVLASYKEGWDRTSAATAIGMGNEKQIQDALAVTAEKIQISKDRLIAYGLIIGDGTQDAVKKYEDSMRAFGRESDLTSQGFKRAIADNIMPVLTDLSDFFREGFPTAVMSFRYSLAVVTSLFYGLKTVVYMVSESILGSISAIGIGFGGLAEASFKALKGDFSGAKNSLIQGWTDAKTRLGLIGDNIVEQARRNSAAMALAWGADSLGAGGAKDIANKSGKLFVPKPDAPKPEAAPPISDYEKLAQEIAKLNAESEKRLTVGRELTTGEKKMADIVAMRATGEKTLSDAAMASLKVSLDHLDANEKLIKNNEKLIEVKKQLKEIIEKDKTAAIDAIERMTFENSLIGRSAEQQDKLRSVFESQLEMRHKIAAIDKETRGLHDIGADNAEIENLKAASAARIKVVHDELEDAIQVKAKQDALTQIKAAKLGSGIPVGAQILEIQAAAAKQLAQDEYAHALAKITDLNAVIAVEKIDQKLKADIAASDAIYADESRQQAVGREIRETETHNRIANFQASETSFGATKIQFEQAALALLDDKVLNQQRGMEIARANAALSRQMLTDEADLQKQKFTLKGGQLAYDNASLQLKQTMLEIDQHANDEQAQQIAGLEYKKQNAEEMIKWIGKQSVLEIQGLETGKMKNMLETESLRLAKEIDAIKNSSRVGDAAKAELARIEAARVAQAATLSAEKAQLTRWNDMLNTMDKSFHDSFLLLLNNGLTSWNAAMKALGNSFKTLVMDEIYKQLLKPIVLKAVISIAGLTGTTGLATAATNNLSALTGSGGGGDALSMLSSLRTAYTTVTDFVSGIGSHLSGISAAAEDAAMFGGNVASSGTSVAGTTTSSTALGSAATYLGAAAGGFVIGKMISGGYSAIGKSGNATVIIGEAIGALFVGTLGPLGIVLGGAIGGLVNRLFGRKLTETGIQGTFSGAGFSGQNYTHEKGGFFRSDRETTSPLDAALDKSLDQSYSQLRSSALLLGNVFKDTSHSLDDFSYSLKLNFLGLNADQSKALITGELTKMGDAMASQVLSDIARAEMATAGITDSLATQVETYWKEFERGGESATDTLTRLSGSLAGVNSWLEKLGMNMFATTLSAGNMASQLVDLFGSMDKFTGAMQKYVSIYFSATEKLGMGIKDMGESFGNLGQKLPGTLEEMRALIEAQNLTTESGRAAYAGLINLSEGFAALYQSSGQAALGGRSLMVAWQDQSAQLKTLINSFDNTSVAEAALGVAARTRYQIELALIKQINDALQSTHAMFTNTIEEMRFSTLDQAGKYKFLQDKSTELEGLLGSTIDPAEITRISADLNKVTRDAWMLLSEDERKVKLAAYEKYINEIDALAKTRLELAKTEITKEGGGQSNANEAIAAAIAAGIESALARSADRFDKAATDMQAAANTPVKVDVTAHVDVNVDTPASVEVGIL